MDLQDELAILKQEYRCLLDKYNELSTLKVHAAIECDGYAPVNAPTVFTKLTGWRVHSLARATEREMKQRIAERASVDVRTQPLLNGILTRTTIKPTDVLQ